MEYHRSFYLIANGERHVGVAHGSDCAPECQHKFHDSCKLFGDLNRHKGDWSFERHSQCIALEREARTE